MPNVVTVQLTPQARDLIRRFQLVHSAAAGHRLTMAEAVEVAIKVANSHADEISALFGTGKHE